MPLLHRQPKTRQADRLSAGGRIALIAPAFSFNAELAEKGRAFLDERYALKTVCLDSIHERSAYFAGDDKRRVGELLHWLTNDHVAGLLAVRGGYGCARIYPELVRLLGRNGKKLKPKIVAGYSDLTILLNGLYQDYGWITFHAPVLVGKPFREPHALESKTFEQALFTAEPLGPITDPKMIVLNEGLARGPIVGGCLSLVASSVGTPYAVRTEGKVLFLEDVDERPYRLDRMLTQMIHAGVFNKVRGVVFGQMTHCEPAPNARDVNPTTALEAIELTLVPFLKKRGVPALYNFPAGHGSPQVTFPIGVRVEVQADKNGPALVFLEAGVK